MRLPYHFKKMRSRFTFWFMVIALIPLIIATIIIYKQREENIKFTQFEKLISIRDLKVNEVNNWLDERIGDINTIASDPEIREYLAANYKNVSEIQYERKAEELLERYIRHYSVYLELFLLDSKTGHIVLSTNRSVIGEDKTVDPYFTGPMQTHRLFIKDIYLSHTLGNKPGMTFSIPVYGKIQDKKVITGVLVARIDLQNSLYKSLLNRTGLGETGETLIVNKKLYALNELRHYENAPLNLHITAKPAVEAAAGNTGIIEVDDYRGEPVLAAYTYIPRTGWGFVAKQDQKEIYAPISEMLVNMMVLVVIIASIIYILSLLLAKSITQPILNMVSVANRFGSGDYSARNSIITSDETAVLAKSFNELSESVESRILISTSLGEILEIFVTANNMEELSQNLIRQLINLTQSQLGVLYLYNDDNHCYEPIQSIGFASDRLTVFQQDSLEGEFGKVLTSKRILFTSDLSEETQFVYKTIIGTAIPHEVVHIPVMVKEKMVAIISLASMEGFSERIKEMIKQSWSGINTGFTSRMAEEETRRVAAELKDKNQELEELAEEFKAQADELQEQNIELAEQRNQVENANKLKSQFLTNMSHELRTPLNSILSLSSVLHSQTSDRLSDEELRYLEIVERNGRQLLTLINDILDLSKIESGQMDVNISELSLPQLTGDLLENFIPLAEEKGISLNLSIPKELPTIHSDEFLIQRIMQNIIGNAIKFTENGGVTIEVIPEKESILFVVEDTGIGIASEDLPYVFDEFRQADGSTSRRFEGTGLGLAIAKRSAMLLGGDITVESEKGKGTIITVRLPLKSQPAPGSNSPITKAMVPEPRKSNKPYKLLIVEDQEPVVLQLTSFLEKAGYQVDVAPGGKDAIDYCKETTPDGIILDLMMPEIDGFAVLETIRSKKETKQLPVLILTAKDLTSEERSQLSANNVQQLVQKGDIDQKRFLEKIDLMFGIERTTEDIHSQPHDKKPPTAQRVVRDHPVILIVEDKPDNLITIKALIPPHYTVLEATDGESGLEAIYQHKPDLVLLDIMLPKMDGLTVLQKIREDETIQGISVFAITAKAMKGDKERLLKAGFDAYFSKPLEPKKLQQKIKSTLER